MRVVGSRVPYSITLLPTAKALAAAEPLFEVGARLPAIADTGIIRGVYRFATHEEANRHAEEALVRVVAANARARGWLG